MRPRGPVRSFATAFVLGTVVSTAASAQAAPDSTFTLSGSVYDASTGRPIPGAVIKFPELRRVAYSDLEGSFQFEDFPVGTWHLVIEQLGYHTSETDAPLTPENGIQVNLRPDPVALAGFRVLSRSERLLADRSRKIPYRVRTLPQELFAEAVQVDASSIFRGNADVAIMPCDRRDRSEDATPGCFWRRGGLTKIDVYMDEGPLMGGMDELSMYLPRDIHSMEWVAGMAMLRVYTHRFIERLDNSRISLEPLVYEQP